MDDLDYLFDEVEQETPVSKPVSLTLPPVTGAEAHSREHHNQFFDENVGTIALPGSLVSEHSIPSSSSRTPKPLQAHTQRSSATPRMEEGKTGFRPSMKQVNKPRTRRQATQVVESSFDTAGPSRTKKILADLAKDPNIIPLLQSIVEYVYHTDLRPNQTQGAPSSPNLSSTDERPPKRRRLEKVPAGAEDWTVPYPFKEGEGPQNYKEQWEIRRLLVLLRVLMRNLKDWDYQRRPLFVDPKKQNKTSRGRHSESISTPGPIDDIFSNLTPPSQTSQLDLLPNVDIHESTSAATSDSAFDDIMALLGSFSDPVPPITAQKDEQFSRQILSDAPMDMEKQGWENLTQLLSLSTETRSIESSFLPTPETPQEDSDVQMIDASLLENGVVDPSPQNDTLIAFSEPDAAKHPELGLGLSSFDPIGVNSSIQPMDLDQLFDAVPLSQTHGPSLPSLTDSSSASVDMRTPITLQAQVETPSARRIQLETPAPTFVQLQDLALSAPSPSTSAIPVLSKRGKGRSSQALRRDLNKQLRQNAVDPVAIQTLATKGGPEGPSSSKTTSAANTGGKKSRVNEATIKDREVTLERAKEWREAMAKQLEKARMARWEAMMEGIVLREIGLLLRNRPGNNST